MGSNNKKYWLDKSTLAGVVKTGGEIPKGLITDERMAEFESKGLVGEKAEATIEAPKVKKEDVKNDDVKTDDVKKEDVKKDDEKKSFLDKIKG